MLCAHAQRGADPLAGKIFGQMFRYKVVEPFFQATGHQPGHLGLAQRLGRKGKQIPGRAQNAVGGAGQLPVGFGQVLLRNAVLPAQFPGPAPFRVLVCPLHNVAQQQIARHYSVHLDGGDGLDQASMAGIDQRFALLPGLAAGFLVT